MVNLEKELLFKGVILEGLTFFGEQVTTNIEDTFDLRSENILSFIKFDYTKWHVIFWTHGTTSSLSNNLGKLQKIS